MKFTKILKAIAALGSAPFIIAGCDTLSDTAGSGSETGPKFTLSIDEIQRDKAKIRVRHDGADDVMWYTYVDSTKLSANADELIDSIIAVDLEFYGKLTANSGKNKMVQLSGLKTKRDHRLIVKAIASDGKTYGKAGEISFRTKRDLDEFDLCDWWDMTYKDRTISSEDNTEYDNFTVTTANKSPYLTFVIKKSDFESVYGGSLRKCFEEYLEYYIKNNPNTVWKELQGDRIHKEECLRHGEYWGFAIGVDNDGELDGYYSRNSVTIEEEEAEEEFSRWLGEWTLEGRGFNHHTNEYNDVKYTLLLQSTEANRYINIYGYESSNSYSSDLSTTCPIEVRYSKKDHKLTLSSQVTGQMYLDSYYSTFDIYMFGNVKYESTTSYIPLLGIDIATLEMNETTGEAVIKGLTYADYTFDSFCYSFYWAEFGNYMTFSTVIPSISSMKIKKAAQL